MGKIILIVEDDWEIMGNGLGNVAHLQYLPCLYLLELAKKLNIKINFMVEVLQQLAFRKFSCQDRNLEIQARLWDECILLMKERGHDVQLHIHPQWYQCTYQQGYFLLSRNWNIATYPRPERHDMIAEAISYLTSLIRPVDPQYQVIGFKAGAWALQPSQGILEDMASQGIRIVMAGGRGIHYSTNEILIDYLDMEEDTLPYYPDFQDIRRISNKKEDIIVLPLPFL